MKLSKLVATAAALSLAVAPALAAPQPAAAVIAAEPAAAESVEGEALYRTGILVPLAGLIALALVVYLVIDSTGGDDEPASP